MISFDTFFAAIENSILAEYADGLKQSLHRHFDSRLHGNAEKWLEHFSTLPEITASSYDLNSGTLTIGTEQDLDAEPETQLREKLLLFKPWRKGPINIFGQFIDTEWRSDWKWKRVAPHLSPLQDKTVLDIGCGNGYHCFRMLGEGARLVVGVDPTRLFFMQFNILKKYLPNLPVYYLPLKGEHLPRPMPVFDTVFSMGVLYHRRSPFDHLEELRDCLVSGGELVLESLVIEGDDQAILVPRDRYAQMRNVWFLPSAAALENWLRRCGFVNIRTVDTNQTSCDEQRATEWMVFQSLSDFLDPGDPNRTIEGYPAPRRATLIAEKP
jgi:tRNA (mo5U34)-methyltransferase